MEVWETCDILARNGPAVGSDSLELGHSRGSSAPSKYTTRHMKHALRLYVVVTMTRDSGLLVLFIGISLCVPRYTLSSALSPGETIPNVSLTHTKSPATMARSDDVIQRRAKYQQTP